VKYAIHVLCIQDDFCLEEGLLEVIRQARESGHEADPFIAIPALYRDGTSCVGDEVSRVEAIAARNKWAVDRIDNSAWVNGGLPRWKAEAELRNEAVRRVRERGYGRVLIADSDELWTPGCFGAVHALAESGAAQYVYHAFLPVIGLPGYPIEGALDTGLVYIDASLPFLYSRNVRDAEGRHPGVKWVRTRRQVMHFTMVRKSVEAVARKARRSSHYGETFYDYESWIRDVLPQIRPGMIDASFFNNPKMGQFWPLVRHFSPEEWGSIPAALRPYLGSPVPAVP